MKILLVIDMQNDFISGSLGTKEAEGIVDNVVKLIESGDFDYLCYTKDTHHMDYHETIEGKKVPEHCMIMSEGWQLHPDVQKVVDKFDEKVISFIKRTFGSTDLMATLEGAYDELNHDIKRVNESFQIDVVGLCTDICVITNVLTIKSFVPEAEIRVHADCCAGTTPENHEAALKVMKACLIDIV